MRGVVTCPQPEAAEVGRRALLDGARAYHLAGRLPAGAFDPTIGEFKAGFWIGVEDGLPVQIKAEGAFALTREVGT